MSQSKRYPTFSPFWELFPGPLAFGDSSETERSSGSIYAHGSDLQKQFRARQRRELGEAVREVKLQGFDADAQRPEE